MTIHIKMLDGFDTHHIIEAVFKSFARALRIAVSYDENNKDILLKLGTCYVRANQDEKALEPYLKVLTFDKNNFLKKIKYKKYFI